MLTFPGCKNAFACFLGELLGAMVDSWTRPYFILLAVLAFLLAMLIGRWRSAALLGLAVAIFTLSILFVALSPREAVSVQLTGRVVPTLLGGLAICSAGWLAGRIFVRFLLSPKGHKTVGDGK
jgi:predicted MFS family arabinose efflux permease